MDYGILNTLSVAPSQNREAVKETKQAEKNGL
jgi:hypothetical protein